jgi:DNA-binding NarL/FixJ family response regulator
MPTAARVDPQMQQGQFSYHTSPASLWPDFLLGQESQPLRVALVDNDARMRSVIGQELNQDNRINLVASASNLRDGKLIISRHEFDVLLLDFSLGDGVGFDLIKHMKMHRPSAEAIVMSVMDDEDHAITAFELGATGYLVKNSWFGNFSQAVLQVANGGAYISPNLARRLLNKLATIHHAQLHAVPVQTALGGRSSGHSAGLAGHPAGPLSFREKEILELVAAGCTSLEIASRINISRQTVTTHMKNIYRKLQVHSRAQAVTQARNQDMLN